MAHFDGEALIPDHKIDLPQGVPLRLTIEVAAEQPSESQDSFLRLAGLGAEIWDGIDGVEYQRREREGWE
jgi:hypothetical protein